MINTVAGQAASLIVLSLLWLAPHGKSISTAEPGCEAGNGAWMTNGSESYASTTSSQWYQTPGGDISGVTRY